MSVFTSVNRMLASVLSATSAMAGFSVALLAGLLAENTIVSILERSLISLGVCYLGGFFVGHMLDGVIERHAQNLRVSEAESQESPLDPPEIESDDQPSGLGSTA